MLYRELHCIINTTLHVANENLGFTICCNKMTAKFNDSLVNNCTILIVLPHSVHDIRECSRTKLSEIIQKGRKQ